MAQQVKEEEASGSTHWRGRECPCRVGTGGGTGSRSCQSLSESSMSLVSLTAHHNPGERHHGRSRFTQIYRVRQ